MAVSVADACQTLMCEDGYISNQYSTKAAAQSRMFGPGRMCTHKGGLQSNALLCPTLTRWAQEGSITALGQCSAAQTLTVVTRFHVH